MTESLGLEKTSGTACSLWPCPHRTAPRAHLPGRAPGPTGTRPAGPGGPPAAPATAATPASWRYPRNTRAPRSFCRAPSPAPGLAQRAPGPAPPRHGTAPGTARTGTGRHGAWHDTGCVTTRDVGHGTRGTARHGHSTTRDTARHGMWHDTGHGTRDTGHGRARGTARHGTWDMGHGHGARLGPARPGTQPVARPSTGGQSRAAPPPPPRPLWRSNSLTWRLHSGARASSTGARLGTAGARGRAAGGPHGPGDPQEPPGTASCGARARCEAPPVAARPGNGGPGPAAPGGSAGLCAGTGLGLRCRPRGPCSGVPLCQTQALQQRAHLAARSLRTGISQQGNAIGKV